METYIICDLDGSVENRLSEIERKVLFVIQQGIPITPTPYQDMARQAGVDTQQFLHILHQWKKDGKLRRIGAIVNHFQAGAGCGAMVAWEVEAERIEPVGRVFAGFESVSHAYERKTAPGWPYTIYTMVHGSSEEEVRETVRQMSETAGVFSYRILMTERELKKSPPVYIVEPDS